MKIYVIGDSISIQYGPYLKDYLEGNIEYSRKQGEEEALRNLDRPVGANGGDSGMVLSFLQSKAEEGGIDADLMLLNCGLHDIKTHTEHKTKQVSISEYEKNLTDVVEVVREMKPKLCWMRTTPCDDSIHNKSNTAFFRYSADVIAYNRVADRIMAEFNVPIIDLYSFTMNLGPDLYFDHVHFNTDIRKSQAAFIAGWLMAYKDQMALE